MSTLALVRHGQGSAFKGDYDQLSPRGIEQARALGSSWAERKLAIDAIYYGPRRRHLQTVEHLRAAAADAGHPLPEPKLSDGFDEVELSRLFGDAMKRVTPMCPDFVEQIASGTPDDHAKTALTHFLGMVDSRLQRWALGEPIDGVQSFDEFSTQVRHALTAVLREQGRDKHVVVITSGGPIAVCLKLALQIDAGRSVGLMRQLINASVSELLYTESSLSLHSFNRVGHLTPELTTRI